MKIKILKKVTIGQVTVKPGKNVVVDNNTGKRLCNTGFAKSEDFITLAEAEAEKMSRSKAEDILEEMPVSAMEIRKKLKNIFNVVVLEHYIADSRISVRKAAIKRLEEVAR